jgi:hypothetical protein
MADPLADISHGVPRYYRVERMLEFPFLAGHSLTQAILLEQTCKYIGVPPVTGTIGDRPNAVMIWAAPATTAGLGAYYLTLGVNTRQITEGTQGRAFQFEHTCWECTRGGVYMPGKENIYPLHPEVNTIGLQAVSTVHTNLAAVNWIFYNP